MPSFRMRLCAALVVAVACLLGLARPAGAVSSTIVVSQVYGGGGNSGATLKNDFIELYNRSAAPVSVTGWSVQYAATTGTTWQRTALSGTIAAGGYSLVQEAAGAGGTVNLPPPDATGSIAMAAGAGKVVLMTNNTTIASGTVCPLTALDLVGYGSGTNCSETLPTATLSNTTAALRNGGGSVDTDNNSADFSVGAPNPRNTGDQAPTVSSTTPANGAGDVALNSNITITFSEPVNVTGSWYSISCSSSDGHSATVSGGPTTFTLDPDSDFVGSETCTVTVFAANVSDQDATDPPDNMAANYVFSFSTVAPPVPIHDIQGAAHISPRAGQTVSNVNGIVTAKRSNGFYVQDPNPDADPATSEGIFVFTSSAPSSVNVGDAVKVNGRVQEFRPGGSSSANLTTTDLTSPTTTVLSSGNPLPATTIVGTGGRIPPNQIIEDDATGDVETSGVFDPANDGLDFWESLEGMRLQLNNPVAVGPTNAFGETQLVADDVLVPLPAMNVGDHYDAPLVGVLDYNFGNFFLEVTSAGVGAVHDGVTPESTTAAGLNQVSIGTFNFENLDPTDPQSKFDRLAAILVNNLESPDIVSGEEVQDDNGPTNDAVVDANQTLDQLASFRTADPNANVVVDGDLNDFEFSDTVSILKSSVLSDLIDTLPQNERYSYVFEGNSQTLDHILTSDALLARPFAYDVVHVNSEFADQASDHEPSAVKITLNDPPTASAGGPYSVAEGSSVVLSASGSDPEGGPLSYAWDLDDDGTFETPGQTATFSADDGPATPTVKVQVTDNGGLTDVAQATVQVTNVAPTVTSLTPNPVTGLVGQGITFTGSATDPSSADTAAGFSWAFDTGSGFGAFGANGFVATYTSCGTYTVDAEARDTDGGVSQPFTSPPVQVYSGSVLPPLTAGAFNLVQKGQVVPVKITVGCNGFTSGLHPAISIRSGDYDPSVDPGDPSYTVPPSGSAADTSGVMREITADQQYVYNLAVPSNTTAGALYTVLIRPFGGSAPTLYAVLKIKK